MSSDRPRLTNSTLSLKFMQKAAHVQPDSAPLKDDEEWEISKTRTQWTATSTDVVHESSYVPFMADRVSGRRKFRLGEEVVQKVQASEDPAPTLDKGQRAVVKMLSEERSKAGVDIRATEPPAFKRPAGIDTPTLKRTRLPEPSAERKKKKKSVD